MTYQDLYGQWALVIGASATVGEQFARQLGAKGMNVALVARRKEQLDTVAAEISEVHGVETRTIALDLLEETAIEQLRDQTADLEIGFLVINANRHQVGHFDLMSLDDKRTMTRMNFEMPIVLTHFFGADMIKRRRGAVLLLNEVHCLSPLDFDAVFQGTKAGLRLFTESLWAEYRKSNVRVASLHLSGIEESESFNAKITPARRRIIKAIGASMEPSAIVSGALKQFDKGKLILAPDTWTFLNIYTLKFTDLMRLVGGRVSIVMQSGFFGWFMDGEGSREGREEKRG